MTPTARRLKATALFLSILCAHGAAADQVRLKSGDRLMGRLDHMDWRVVVIKTSFAKRLKVRRAKVATIRTDAPVTVVLRPGTYLTARLISAADGVLSLEVLGGRGTEDVPLKNVEAIYRGDPLEALIDLRGHLNAGLSSTTGNSNNESYTILGELVARTPQNRYTLGVEFRREYREETRTANRGLGRLKYDHFLTKKWYLFNSASFEHDASAQLNLRTALTAGFGYQFYDSRRRSLSAELGAGYVSEDFDLAEDDEFPSGRWAVDFQQAIWRVKRTRFFHSQEGLVGIEDTRDLVIRTRTGLLFKLVRGLIATLQLNLDWDNDPAPGNMNMDKEYLLTVGYQW
ncbi:MAG: DUF481 domain-containing protein [Gammaproteobacteria bacterium]